MGLDMYAYAATREGQNAEYWNNATFCPDTKMFVNRNATQPREIAYWRKHPNLHGWMERLWIQRGRPCAPEKDPEMFNGVELELTREDIDRLEQDILDASLPDTEGFFFGQDSDDYYRAEDLEFIKQARAELFLGMRVFYNSSW